MRGSLVHHDIAVLDVHLPREGPVVGIVLQEMGVGLGVDEVVNGRHLQGGGMVLIDSPKDLAPDAPEPVDAILVVAITPLLG